MALKQKAAARRALPAVLTVLWTITVPAFGQTIAPASPTSGLPVAAAGATTGRPGGSPSAEMPHSPLASDLPPRAAAVAGPPSPSRASGSPSGDEGWHFSVAPYIWAPAVSGELRARDRLVDVDEGDSDAFAHLNFAYAFRFEAQGEKLGLAFDQNYVKMSADRRTERGLIPDFRFGLTTRLTEIEGTYRLWSTGHQEEPAGGPVFAVDILGGVRAAHIATDVVVSGLVLGDRERQGEATFFHGYVGNRLVYSPARRVTLSGRYNLSLASDLSWLVNGLVEVRILKHVSLDGGYQVLHLRLEGEERDAALNARLFGPILHLNFRF